MNWILTSPSCPSWSSLNDESAIRGALIKLSDEGSSLHFRFKVWTALVAIGVLLEIIFCIFEYLEERHELRASDLVPRTVPTLWLFVFAIFAASLVAIGVSGELDVENQIEKLESCVRAGNDALFLLLSREAQSAQQSADDAAQSATDAKSDAHDANVLAGKAQGKANKAGASARLADSNARNAQQYATDLRTELLSFKLEASAIMSGHLFRRGDFKFALSLGPARVDITAVDGAKFETVSFAETLGQIFEDSKWHVDHQRMTDGRGIVIHNKWVDSPAIAGPAAPRGASYEIDPDMPAIDLIAKSGGKLNMREAMRLSTLSSGLDAKLQKDPEGDLQGDTLRIIIGDP
jgi:hypothetical protein